MITEYKFNTTDSPDVNLIIDFMDGIQFEMLARGKSFGNKSLIKSYFNKRSKPKSGQKTPMKDVIK